MNFLTFHFIAFAPLAESISDHWDSPGLLFGKLLAIVALVFLNGFFVAAEFALGKIRSSQLEALAEEGNARAATAQKVAGDLDAYLSACQLGITLASRGLGWVGGPFVAPILQPVFLLLGINSPSVITSVSFLIAFSVITFLHIVLGEQAPKF